MIRYQLVCACAHEFEAWFASSAAYEEQRSAGLLRCPLCGGGEVRKAPMAPAIARGARTQGEERRKNDRVAALYRALRAIQNYVETHFEHVGPRFAEEARRIHYGESEPRDIYGEASEAEIEELSEEGIRVGRLPRLPDVDA